MAQHLHGGEVGFLGRAAAVAARGPLPGRFAGQQGEFSVAVVHQVNNRIISCLTTILHNTQTAQSEGSSQGASGLQTSSDVLAGASQHTKRSKPCET